MRIINQLVVAAVLAGAGVGGWYAWQNFTEKGTTAAAQSGQGRGSGAGSPIVEVVTVQTGVVTERSESVGTARANESITITAKLAGIIEKIGFEEGQKVTAGQPLIQFEKSERKADFDQARADTEQARAQRDEIRQQLERAKQLRGQSVAEARLDQLDSQFRAADGRVRGSEAKLRAVEARLEDFSVAAPFNGRVGLRQVSLGALVQPGAVITTLDDISTIKLEFSIPELVVSRVRSGQPVLARSAAYPDRIFQGAVNAVDTRIDTATRAVRVNATFENPEEVLKPGMFLSVELILSRRDNATLIPEEALVGEGTRQYVFVIKDNRAERREVEIGQRLAGEVEVVKGLAVGESIVVRGIQRIRQGQQVTVRPFRPTT